MSEAKTLMQLAGAPSTPKPIAESALLLIDMQKQYTHAPLALPDVAGATESGAHLLERFRHAGRPVIHIQHKGQEGGLFDPTDEVFEILGPVAPQGHERVFHKTLPNAFAKTELDSHLRAEGINHLTVIGFMTHMCVSSTVRAALDLGIGCTLVASACGTRDLPDGQGGVISADALHRAELSALSDRFAIVVPDEQALR